MVDQPGAIPMFVPLNITFDSTDATWIVLHKTAGFSTAQQCAAYFANNPGKASAHYVVGQDGVIVQCVSEARGAGANCCLESGHATYLPSGVNLNTRTISIEHIDPATDNSTPLTPAQFAASVQLVHDVCVRHNIPMRSGDSSGGIIGHNDIDPINRSRCPGNYDRAALFAALEIKKNMGAPDGWSDNGSVLKAPNGVEVVLGFRDHILRTVWDKDNMPLEAEYNADPVLIHAPGWGAGQRQMFRDTMLWWTEKAGVIEEPYVGAELDAAYKMIDQLHAVPPPPPTPENVKPVIDQVIAILQKLT